MSIHPNPDGSFTDGMKSEPNGSFISHALNISVTAATGIGASVAAAKTAGANQAIVQVLAQIVNYTLDGTTPTTAAGGGVQIPVGGQIVLNMTDAAAAKFISAVAGGILNVTYTM